MFARVQQVHEKWVNIRTLLQTKLINILSIHTNPDFKFLAECTEWVAQKLVRFRFTITNKVLSFSSVKMTYDHWAAVSSSLRQNLLIPLGEGPGGVAEVGGTVVRIEADGTKTRTVITMGGSVDTNNSFRFIQECMEWVGNKLVSPRAWDDVRSSLRILFLVLFWAYLLFFSRH